MRHSSRPGCRPATSSSSRGRSSMAQAQATRLRSGWHSLPIRAPRSLLLHRPAAQGAEGRPRCSAAPCQWRRADRPQSCRRGTTQPILARLLTTGMRRSRRPMPAKVASDRAAANASVTVMTPAATRGRARHRGSRKFRRCSLVGAYVSALPGSRRPRPCFSAGQIAFSGAEGRLVVPPAPGQGAAFIFRESP